MPRPRRTLSDIQVDVNQNLRNPTGLAARRVELYGIEAGLVKLGSEEWEAYWPYMSNVWRRKGDRYLRQSDGVSTEHYYCRHSFEPKDTVSMKGGKKTAKETVEDAQKPARTMNKAVFCPASLLVEFHLDGIVTILQNREHSEECSLDECDKTLTNNALKRKCELLCAHGIQPAAVYALIAGTGIHGRQQLLDAGGKYLTSRKIKDCRRRLLENDAIGSDTRTDGYLLAWEEQATEADGYLDSHDWKHDYFEVPKNTQTKEAKQSGKEDIAHGIAFAHEKRLQKLCQHGVLIMMDSTHKMNYLGWYLFTVMVRDSYGSYWRCAHLLTDSEDSSIIARWLRVIKEWCRGLEGECLFKL
jgi:hypothetical protein